MNGQVLKKQTKREGGHHKKDKPKGTGEGITRREKSQGAKYSRTQDKQGGEKK